MKKRKFKFYLQLAIITVLIVKCAPNIFHINKGVSTSHGTTANGSIENSYQINYFAQNYRYFSPVSYYIMGNGYIHSKVYYTLVDAYKECERTCPGTYFRIMECSDRKGGKLLMHRTHRNGLSVDFMIPKKRKDKQATLFDHLGLWHYLLNFDSKGKLKMSKNVVIDFETIGKHIIALDNAARKHGLRVSKVILKINLKDDFYATAYGKEIKRRGIYFAQYLTPKVDMFHDDHYHIDFKEVK